MTTVTLFIDESVVVFKFMLPMLNIKISKSSFEFLLRLVQFNVSTEIVSTLIKVTKAIFEEREIDSNLEFVSVNLFIMLPT